MNKVDIAYFAGIFDGEGCICIRKVNTKYITKSGIQRICTSYSLDVCLANTNEWICRQLLFAFGGSVYKRKLQMGANQTVWAWEIAAKKATDFLRVLYPYLKLKRAQAEIAINFQNKMHRRTKTNEELALREAQRILVSNLNRPIRKQPKDEGAK